jgi:hypothetical protein
MDTILPRHVSLRYAVSRLRLPGPDLLRLLEEIGRPAINLGSQSRPRYRIQLDDLVELLRRSRRPDARAARNRAELIEALAAERVLGAGVRR